MVSSVQPASAMTGEATGSEVEQQVTRLGKYELIARIGEGGMAEVYLARMLGPMNFEKILVVKTIHPQLVTEQEFLTMLFDEARLSALIRHPNVVDIYELGHADNMYFIAMEYLEGQALSTLIAAGAKGYDLDPCAVARLIAAGGLHAAHELHTSSGKALELVHRDISPANLMVLYDGSVKVLDFGVAKARGRLTQSLSRQLKGKVGYASPEQLSGQKIDRRSDIFSLGVVLWEALAYRRLFASDEAQCTMERMQGGAIVPPSTHRPQVPPPLDDVCLRALAVDPAHRYQTAAQFKEALEDVIRMIGSHRETEAVAAYMQRVFARRRTERSKLLHRRATTAQQLAIAVDAMQSPERTQEIAPTTAAMSRRSRWWAVGAAISLIAVGAAAAVVARGQDEPQRAPPAPARTTVVPSPMFMTAPTPPVPAPVVVTPPTPPPPEEKPEKPEEAKPSKSAAALYREGADLFIKGKAAEASRRFKDAIDVDSRHAPSYRGLGLAYQSMGKKDKAAAAFKKYLKLAPSAPDAASIRTRLESMAP